MHDLQPVPGQPGQMRCVPQRACYENGPAGQSTSTAEIVTCAAHGRKRDRRHCVERPDGTYECSPQLTCRTGVGVTEQRGVPFHSNAGGYATGHSSKPGIATPQGAAAPQTTLYQSNFAAGTRSMQAPPVQVASNVPAGLLTESSEEVWCARHGRRLPQHMCQSVFGLYHVCVDSAACTASALEPVSALASKGCDELICQQHNRARKLVFMELDAPPVENRDQPVVIKGYRCRPEHACRTGRVAPPVE